MCPILKKMVKKLSILNIIELGNYELYTIYQNLESKFIKLIIFVIDFITNHVIYV